MEKILITPLVGLGDTLMMTPALRLLKTHHPDFEITAVTLNRGCYDIIRNNPDIDRLRYFPLTTAGFGRGCAHILLHYSWKHTVSINFYPSNRAAYNLFSALSFCPVRIGHRYLHNDLSQLNWLKNRTVREDPRAHCVRQNVRLLKFLDNVFTAFDDDEMIPPMRVYLTGAEKEAGAQYRRMLGDGTVVGVHAGTSVFKGHGRRRWPKERFTELIDSLPDIRFVLFGTTEDAEANEYIAAHVRNRAQVVTAATATIREAAAIIGTLDAFVSNDSGLMHVAAAMETPVVAVLGPTNPDFIAPWKVRHRVVRTGLDCSPCFYYSPRPLRCTLDGSFRCLAELPAGMVGEALAAVLSDVGKRKSSPSRLPGVSSVSG